MMLVTLRRAIIRGPFELEFTDCDLKIDLGRYGHKPAVSPALFSRLQSDQRRLLADTYTEQTNMEKNT